MTVREQARRFGSDQLMIEVVQAITRRERKDGNNPR
jgi:hypothetical protein